MSTSGRLRAGREKGIREGIGAEKEDCWFGTVIPLNFGICVYWMYVMCVCGGGGGGGRVEG